jgi:hypothetical protein
VHRVLFLGPSICLFCSEQISPRGIQVSDTSFQYGYGLRGKPQTTISSMWYLKQDGGIPHNGFQILFQPHQESPICQNRSWAAENLQYYETPPAPELQWDLKANVRSFFFFGHTKCPFLSESAELRQERNAFHPRMSLVLHLEGIEKWEYISGGREVVVEFVETAWPIKEVV